MTELAHLDATAQADLVRRKEVSPLELVDDTITRVEKLNPELNAIIHPLFDQARATRPRRSARRSVSRRADGVEGPPRRGRG